MDFEQVWQQILEIARRKKNEGIYTLSQDKRRAHNQIVSVMENAIDVVSEKTREQRKLPKRDFRRCWKVLIEDGQLSIPPVHVWNERIIMAFLAYLPNVEYSTRPQTLYLMPIDTHPKGTRRERV